MEKYLQDLAVFSPPVRQSSISSGASCQRYALYRYRWGLTPKLPQRKRAARVGTLVHKLLEVGLSGAEQVLTTVKTEQAEVNKLILSGQDLTGDLLSLSRQMERNYWLARAIVETFWERYPVPATLETLAKELPISETLTLEDGTEISLAGIIDSVICDNTTKALYIRDTKTSSDDLQYTLTGYAYGIQCRLYRLLLSLYVKEVSPQILPKWHYPLNGFILDYMRVPGILFCDKDRDFTEEDYTPIRGKNAGITERKRTYFGEPKFSNYINRCREWLQSAGEESCRSFLLPYLNPILDEELLHFIKQAHNLMVRMADPALFPRDLSCSRCKAYRSVCPYYPLCSSNQQQWPLIIEQQFTIENPVAAEVETEAETETPTE
jgi:hypothetical protein